MKCPHCLDQFHPQPTVRFPLDGDAQAAGYLFERLDCPACKKMILNLKQTFLDRATPKPVGYSPKEWQLWPRGTSRPPPPSEVPVEIAQDYREAAAVLPESPKASAALSRRCLQGVLRGAAKVKPQDLSKEIQEVIDRGTLPTHVAEAIDSIRNLGNFAAHPMKDTVTGDVLPVEPGEAEWNLDVLDSLFDFYYVQPAKLKAKRAALDAKLAAAGKPPMK